MFIIEKIQKYLKCPALPHVETIVPELDLIEEPGDDPKAAAGTSEGKEQLAVLLHPPPDPVGQVVQGVVDVASVDGAA